MRFLWTVLSLLVAATYGSAVSIPSVNANLRLADIPADNPAVVDVINSLDLGWEAGSNEFLQSKSLQDVAQLCGMMVNDSEEDVPFGNSFEATNVELPESYDVRDAWGTSCPTTLAVYDQGKCSSCWAFAAAESMSDRICIASNGTYTPELSMSDLLSCCGSSTCGSCSGGYPSAAWTYWVRSGVVTGGAYGNTNTCLPYYWPSCGTSTTSTDCKGLSNSGTSTAPSCTKKCKNSATWANDKWYGRTNYRLMNDQRGIMNDIYLYGPVEAGYTVYNDFVQYKSGVYKHAYGSKLGLHAVKIIGWGNEEKDGVKTPYWWAANSWGSSWGLGGFFKILRGSNECGIEGYVFAGRPRLPSGLGSPVDDEGIPFEA